MPRRSGKRKKTRTHVVENEQAQSALASNDHLLKVPKSVVVRMLYVTFEIILEVLYPKLNTIYLDSFF